MHSMWWLAGMSEFQGGRRAYSSRSEFLDEFRQHPTGYRGRRSQPTILCAHPSVERRGIRVGFDHKVIGSEAGCLFSRPSKEVTADTATQHRRIDKQLEQICFASGDLDL